MSRITESEEGVHKNKCMHKWVIQAAKIIENGF